MMGLGAASKTTILYKLKLGQVVSTDITVGFNVEMVEYKIINFSVMDVGGQSRAWVSQECNDGQVKTRPLWSIYFRKTPCLIFVIDSNDRERVDDARNELHLTLQKVFPPF
ncbi:hypothetical protein Patl1_02768 [Pistacia atlantica]|uniref:Uncharacterized protein n=1 Tax=Pistacia atlantica TaxID=434234 RepID=A0ACC1C7D5_9ROSI|nr:hypothetical protein Patl1_02768 [Pistacia atlantica]